MFATPASFDNFGNQLTRDAAESLSRNWTTLLLDGLVLIVAGVLIWSIDWSVRSLSTFLGALFIFEGIWIMLTAGISGRGANYATGLLSIRRLSIASGAHSRWVARAPAAGADCGPPGSVASLASLRNRGGICSRASSSKRSSSTRRDSGMTDSSISSEAR